MPRERIVLIGLAVLLVGALIFAGAAAGQRSAWMEGFMMGRFTAVTSAPGTGAAAPVAPYAPYAVGYGQHHGPGFGGFLFLLFGVGLIALLASRCAHKARWRNWMAAQGGPQSGTEADWRHGPPPWMQGPGGQGPWDQGHWGGQSGGQSGSGQQGQPGSQPAPGPSPAQSSQPPAGEPPAER